MLLKNIKMKKLENSACAAENLRKLLGEDEVIKNRA